MGERPARQESTATPIARVLLVLVRTLPVGHAHHQSSSHSGGCCRCLVLPFRDGVPSPSPASRDGMGAYLICCAVAISTPPAVLPAAICCFRRRYHRAAPPHAATARAAPARWPVLKLLKLQGARKWQRSRLCDSERGRPNACLPQSTCSCHSTAPATQSHLDWGSGSASVSAAVPGAAVPSS